MSLLDRVLALAKVSENSKTWLTAIAGIGSLVLTAGGVKDFLVKNQLTSPQDIHRIVFDIDRRNEVQAILSKVRNEVQKAQAQKDVAVRVDRTFIFLYKQNNSGQWFTEFKGIYQLKTEGQTYIKDALFPLVKGADTDRFESMNIGLCKETLAWKLKKTDPLAIALKKSGVEAQVACQIEARISGEQRTGGIAVEFSQLSYNKTEVESVLIGASIDVEKAFR